PGHGFPHGPFRRHSPCPELPRLGPRLRHAPRLPLPPPGATAPAVALPAATVAPEDAGPHAGPRRPRRPLPERPFPVDPSRSGRGPRIAVQPGRICPQLG